MHINTEYTNFTKNIDIFPGPILDVLNVKKRIEIKKEMKRKDLKKTPIINKMEFPY